MLNHYITGSFGKNGESVHHVHFRKIAAGPYGFTNVRKMEGLVDLRVQQWIDRLEGDFWRWQEICALGMHHYGARR